ncbi:MAG: M15 family metallopeptidase, partial [Candidatus Taylorbacteria bacterium]
MKTHISDFLKKIHASYWALGGGFVILATVVVLGGIYGYNRLNTLSHDVSVLTTSLASTTQVLRDTIAQTNNNFSNALNQQQQSVQNKLGTYEQQFGTLSGTLDTLQKLSKTDPQLLQKYSKVFFLNENYAPAELTEIPSDYRYDDTKHPTIGSAVWPYLQRMLSDASSSFGIKMYVSSGYRSFKEQSNLKNDYKVTYGAGTANSFSADQGYSEHQLGTAVDLITTGTGGQLEGFDNTPAYQWLQNNAYRYGFVLSYPKDNPFYVFEPWHWRFVGVKLAT